MAIKNPLHMSFCPATVAAAEAEIDRKLIEMEVSQVRYHNQAATKFSIPLDIHLGNDELREVQKRYLDAGWKNVFVLVDENRDEYRSRFGRALKIELSHY